MLRQQERRLPSLQALLLASQSGSSASNLQRKDESDSIDSKGSTGCTTTPTSSSPSSSSSSDYASTDGALPPGGSLRPEQVKHCLHHHMLSFTLQEYIQSTCPYTPLLESPEVSSANLGDASQKSAPSTSADRRHSSEDKPSGSKGRGGAERGAGAGRESSSTQQSSLSSTGGPSTDAQTLSSASSSSSSLQKLLLGKRFSACVGACMEVLSLRFGIYQAELLQIVNLGPTKPVEIYAIVEDCVNR